MTRTLLLTLALAVAIFGVCKGATEKEETKYAPSYCLRFKLNCSSEQKKKHVCCLYPLPEGDAAGNSAAESSSAHEEGGSSGGVKIRPIRLPQREKVATNEEEEGGNSEPVKRPATDIRRSNTGPVSSPSGPAAGKKAAASSPAVVTPAPKRPRICIRLVVNCNSSPDHRCCKYAEEEGEKEEEKVEEEVKQEEKEVVPEEEVVEEAESVVDDKVEEAVVPVVLEEEEIIPEKVIEEVTTSVEEIEQEAEVPAPAAVIPEVASEEPKLTFESVINDQIPVAVEEQPYERIPAECFTNVHDCTANPENRCCDFQ